MFAQGGHLMSNKNANYLMRSHLNVFKKGYEEVHVPASKPKRFADKIYPVAFEQDENLLVCAPTGSGKTNVAMLCILNKIGKNRDEETGILDTEAFKIVYIALMMALVQEMVDNFSI